MATRGFHFNVYGAPIIFWMHENIGRYANEKCIPDFVFNLSRRHRQILFDTLLVGDGSIDPRSNRKNGYYSTTSHNSQMTFSALHFPSVSKLA
jgi:hypothetical protein